MLSRISVGTQLVVAFIVMSCVVIFGMLFFINQAITEATVNTAKQFMQAETSVGAKVLEERLSVASSIAISVRQLSLSIKDFQANGPSFDKRGLAINQLESLLKPNSDYIDSLWVSWFSNAFDGEDEKYINKPYHEKSGRFIPNIFFSNGQVTTKPVTDYNTSDHDFDGLSPNADTVVMTEPYEYVADTSSDWYVTIEYPLLDSNNKLMGLCGTDLTLTKAKSLVDSLKVGDGSGSYILISHKGLIISHPDKSVLGKDFFSTGQGQLLETTVKDSFNNSQPFIIRVAEGFGSEPVYVAGELISFNDHAKPWILISQVPERVILSTSRLVVDTGLKVGLAGVLLSIFAGLLSVKYILGGLRKRIMLVVDNVREDSASLHNASENLMAASHSLAQGAQQQVGSLEKTAAALEELSSMTKRNADNSQEADLLVRQAAQSISKAKDSMSKMTEAMESISRSGHQIGNIIKMIEDVAFQTNLLALNAAVEAARAGEFGAGFAVVADEVRNLAIRSSEAVKSTAEFIDITINNINLGSELVDQTSANFDQVEKMAGDISKLVGEVAEASKEQSLGIDQINNAVNEIDGITQQNMASSEQSAASADDLNEQSASIRETIENLVAIVSADSRAVRNFAHSVKRPRALGSSLGKAPAGIQKQGGVHPVDHKNDKHFLPLGDDF